MVTGEPGLPPPSVDRLVEFLGLWQMDSGGSWGLPAPFEIAPEIAAYKIAQRMMGYYCGAHKSIFGANDRDARTRAWSDWLPSGGCENNACETFFGSHPYINGAFAGLDTTSSQAAAI